MHRMSTPCRAPLLSLPGLHLCAALRSHVAHGLLQGTLLDIVAMILIVTEENLPTGVAWTPWSELFYFLMFWGVLLLVLYCLFFNFL